MRIHIYIYIKYIYTYTHRTTHNNKEHVTKKQHKLIIIHINKYK